VNLPRRALSTSCFALSVLACSVARAGDATPEDLATARALFQQGSSLVNAGRYAEACPKLELAGRLVRGIGVTLYLGECYERTGRLVSAWQQFDQARTMAEAHSDKRAALARDRAQKLWPRLSKLALVVPPDQDVAGLVITDDGVVVDRSTYNVERPAEPRTHHLRARAPDRSPWEASVDVPTAPETVRVDVIMPSDPRHAAPPEPSGDAPAVVEPPPDRASAGATRSAAPAATALPEVHSGTLSGQRIGGIALFGVGVAGLAAGTLFALDAKWKMDASNAGGHCQADNHCDATGLADRSSALSAAAISTAAFVGGLAFLAGGATLYLVAPDDRPPGVALVAHPTNGGGSVTLEGAW